MLQFLKMNAIGNDFIIFDARSFKINLSSQNIQKLCNRKNIGCDQLLIIKNSTRAECFMEIYNQDGSESAVCGNATRCVASLIMEEKNSSATIIETAAGLLNCWRQSDDHNFNDRNISVEMRVPIFETNFFFKEMEFFCVDMGNPHAVIFVDYMPNDSDFFAIASVVETHPFFSRKTNVEFAKVISDEIIEVRVWERGTGETLACGSGACAVAAVAIKNKFIGANKIITRFKGGDLAIEWSGNDAPVIMTGGYKKIFTGALDEKFL